MKKLVISIAALAAVISQASAGATATQVDTQCQRLATLNAGDPDLDSIENYHGCQQVYDGTTLVGFGRGTAWCDRLAYNGSVTLRLTGATFHQYMGRGACVLSEDWAWGAE